MDVTGINGTGYVAMPGGGDYVPAPAPEEKVYVEAAPVVAVAPPPTLKAETEIRAEQKESRRESREIDTLQRATEEINKSVAIYRRHLGIRYHEASKRRMVTVYDSDTNEAIREIPPEKVLDAFASMLEMVGLFADARG
ncbi:MAG: flagellar protein FlaG [Clostridiales bacterium]|jgi:flagellar protein FlaG|nr:flagellar protein FlaG [Clostridiales bacterium]